ncbi:helix-turn-helix domain-containing protein [Paraburkholderia xenovorans]|uniref:helix-turn-helix domain-containing protein n=1 Tax=Paraburkholderia xenovorans TaxID=36873 RepID=UPI0038BDCC62
MDLEFVETAWAAKERLRLSLMAGPDGQLIERQLVQPDGMCITISTRIRSSNDLTEAFESDPHRDALRAAYRRTFEYHDRLLRENTERGGKTLQVSMNTIDSISTTRSEPTLARVVSTLLVRHGQLPAKYIFASYQLSNREQGISWCHFMSEGCFSLLQKFVQRRWYMNDLFLEYARSNSAPSPSDQIEIRSPGQLQAFDAFAQAGFAAGMVSPARTAGESFVAYLLVAGVNDAEGSTELMLGWRNTLRVLAAELVEWRAAARARSATHEYKLSERDIEVLQMLSRGMAAVPIAQALKLSPNQVHRRIYPDIVEKLRVRHISEAAQAARDLGVLSGGIRAESSR